jgi:hypothetical protein
MATARQEGVEHCLDPIDIGLYVNGPPLASLRFVTENGFSVVSNPRRAATLVGECHG